VKQKPVLGIVIVLGIAAGTAMGQGLETFANFAWTGATYTNGTFLGQDGSLWTYIQCSGNKPIVAPSPCLGSGRTPTSEVYSGIITGGIGTLSFDWMKAYSTDVNLDVYVNDTLVKTVTGGTTGQPQTEGPFPINIDGDFVLRFVQKTKSAGQVSLDNIAWSAYGSGPTPTVRFSLTSAPAQNEGSAAQVQVDVLINVATNATVEIASQGNATLGVDFTLSTDRVVFASEGARTQTVWITILDDTDRESRETIILVLTNASGVSLGTPLAFSLEIIDNDTPTIRTPLIISEVADPSDQANARFVELYNAGETAINLATDNWYLSRQANGTTWADIALTGTVAAASTYVVAYNRTNFLSAYGLAADQISGYITGNGDDGYFLFKDGNHNHGTLADAYGVIDEDGTGNAWDYEDGRAVRNPNVRLSNPSWTEAEWTIIKPAATTAMTPGQHTVAGGGPDDDDDGDGIPNAWETLYFGGPTNAVASEDSDGDGRTNWEEWFTGTNPTDGASVFRIEKHADTVPGTAFVIAWPGVSNRVYDVFWTSNLMAGFAVLAGDLPGAPEWNVYTDTVHAANSAAAYKVTVRNP